MSLDPGALLVVVGVVVEGQTEGVARPAEDGPAVAHVAHDHIRAVPQQAHCGRGASVERVQV